MLVLDCAKGMWDKWQSDSKMRVTQQVLLRFLDSIEGSAGMELSLLAAGQETGGRDLHNRFKTLVPGEGTAVTDLLRKASLLLAERPTRNIVWVITDDTDREKELCALSHEMRQQGRAVQTFVFLVGAGENGLEVSDGTVQLFRLRDEEQFDETLFGVYRLSKEMARVTLGLVDARGERYATEVPVTFCDHLTHAVKYTALYHYGVERTVDTLVVDPFTTYDITFYAMPPVRVENYRFKGGIHRAVMVNAQQGELSLSMAKKRVTWSLPDYPVLIRRHGDCALVAKLVMGVKGMFLEGEYDVEVLTLPPTLIKGVKVSAGAATDLQLALPGQLVLTKSRETTSGVLFVVENSLLTRVCDLDPTQLTESLILMPGEYEVWLYSQSSQVQTRRFMIESSQTTKILF